MKNIALVPGILALILCGVLFYLMHQHSIAQPVQPAASPNNSTAAPFRIAYFNLDSLEAHYNYFQDMLQQVRAKQDEGNAELGRLQNSYQKRIAEWQKKGNTMTAEENQQFQQEYAKMQQDFQMRQQNIQEALFKRNEDLKADIREKIQDYLKEYNKSKGYNYIISNESISFVYVSDTTYDITNDLVRGLNEGYKKK
ncbi:MAG TPA: OmpH family outer membrane protein [Puia sp.]|nr:OmpH family outer membrane protein [Puia sp.]